MFSGIDCILSSGIVDSIMSGIKFETQIYKSNQNQSINNSKLHDNSFKTIPKFVDKNQEYAVPLNKGFDSKFYCLLMNEGLKSILFI